MKIEPAARCRLGSGFVFCLRSLCGALQASLRRVVRLQAGATNAKLYRSEPIDGTRVGLMMRP